MPRSVFTGAIQLHALMPVQVAIYKATDEYEDSQSLREVCACHSKPLVRETKCVGGKPRLTQDAVKGGASPTTHAEVVKAVETAPDTFVVVDPGRLDAIGAAVNSDVITVEAVIGYEEAPMEFSGGEAWYVTHNKKHAGAEAAVTALAATLSGAGTVLVGRWAHHGHEHIVAIHTVGDLLVMNRLAYNQEVRDGAPFALDLTSVGDEERKLTSQLLATFPSTLDMSAFENRGVLLKNDAINAAIAGKPIKARPATPATPATPDLLGALKGALAASTAKPKAPAQRKTPAAKKPAAKAAAKKPGAKPKSGTRRR